MKFMDPRTLATFLSLAAATMNIQQEVRLVPGSSFILDTPRNQKFLEFRRKHRKMMERAFEIEKRRNTFTEEQNATYEAHKDEVIDVAFICSYNEVQLWNIKRWKINIEAFMNTGLCLMAIDMFKIPVDGLVFFDPTDISLDDTGVSSAAEFERLKKLQDLECVFCRNNKISDVPNFNGFECLMYVILTNNPIVITRLEDIIPCRNIKYLGLRYIKGLQPYKPALEAAFRHVGVTNYSKVKGSGNTTLTEVSNRNFFSYGNRRITNSMQQGRNNENVNPNVTIVAPAVPVDDDSSSDLMVNDETTTDEEMESENLNNNNQEVGTLNTNQNDDLSVNYYISEDDS